MSQLHKTPGGPALRISPLNEDPKAWAAAILRLVDESAMPQSRKILLAAIEEAAEQAVQLLAERDRAAERLLEVEGALVLSGKLNKRLVEFAEDVRLNQIVAVAAKPVAPAAPVASTLPQACPLDGTRFCPECTKAGGCQGEDHATSQRNLRALKGRTPAQPLDPNAPIDYKAWDEEAMGASNEAGFAGLSAADTIRWLASDLETAQQAVKDLAGNEAAGG